MAKEALKMDDSQLWIYTNLISSYILQDKFTEADNTLPKIEKDQGQINAQLGDWKKFEDSGLFTEKQLDYVNKRRNELSQLIEHVSDK
jgi:predicted translin family RNA/ssDNA-binding protein